MGTGLERQLAAEREHAETARACVQAMRQRASTLRAHGDLGADEYGSAAVQAMLDRRVVALADERTPLFFGRIDYGPDSPHPGERFHIGRLHVHDAASNPVVVDWRAAVARPFYRAGAHDALGLVKRRRFGFAGQELTSFEDETFESGADHSVADRTLRREIERPRIGPMRDIVATIQPEQDDLIRAPVGESIVVQGGPGTGKTAVGLHRAAFVLYERRLRRQAERVLVVGPNKAFLAFISAVLPSLGEGRVNQRTLAEIVGQGATAEEPSAVASLKGDARMAEVLRRAVRGLVCRPSTALAVRHGTATLVLGADQVAEVVDEVADRDAGYQAGRGLLQQQLIMRLHRDAERAGRVSSLDTPADVGKSARKAPAFRALLDSVWPKTTAPRILFDLLGSADVLARAAEGVLDADEQAVLLWTRRPRSLRSAPWSAADMVLLDEIAGLLQTCEDYDHVVVDEAQELSPMQLRAVGRRCRSGSATVLGDLAQGTAPWAVRRWQDAIHHLGKAPARIHVLPRAFRAPRAVLDYANRLLPLIAPELDPAESVRDVAEALEVRRVAHPAHGAADAVAEALRAEGSVAVIAAAEALAGVAGALDDRGIARRDLDQPFDQARVTLVGAEDAKGIEFDHVVLVEPSVIARDGDAQRGLRRLYVCLTRAVTKMVVVHAEPLPEALAGP